MRRQGNYIFVKALQKARATDTKTATLSHFLLDV
jgi:hypothetical protein